MDPMGDEHTKNKRLKSTAFDSKKQCHGLSSPASRSILQVWGNFLGGRSSDIMIFKDEAKITRNLSQCLYIR